MALWDALDNYSLALYGAPGVRLQDTPFMLLWPSLLPDTVVRSLSPRCSAPPTYDGDDGVPFLYWPFNFLMHAALWIQRPTNQVSGTSGFPSHSWVEVTHCGYDEETVNAGTLANLVRSALVEACKSDEKSKSWVDSEIDRIRNAGEAV